MGEKTQPEDNCPRCVPASGPFPPVHTEGGINEIVGFYRCTQCGHRWPCSWLISALGPARHDAA